MRKSRKCSIPECGLPHKARGWCNMHYRRWEKHGALNNPPKAPKAGAATRFFNETVIPYDGDDCLIWPFSVSANGYARIKSNGRDQFVCRLVCEAENGPPPAPNYDAAHSCGNGRGGCVSRKHLSWKTRKENIADKLVHGTSNRGERHYLAKLTEGQVREILSATGTATHRELANKFGITAGNVGAIQRGVSWAWLDRKVAA